MKFAAAFVILFLIVAMVFASQWSSKSSYKVDDLGVDFQVAEFVSTNEVFLRWSDGHRSGESVKSDITLTSEQPVRVKALRKKALFPFWPDKTIRIFAEPAN